MSTTERLFEGPAGPARSGLVRRNAYREAMVELPVPRRSTDVDTVAATSSYRELIERLRRRIRESQAPPRRSAASW